jgi:hypothetical protein
MTERTISQVIFLIVDVVIINWSIMLKDILMVTVLTVNIIDKEGFIKTEDGTLQGKPLPAFICPCKQFTPLKEEE